MRTLIAFVLVAFCASPSWGESGPKRLFGCVYPVLAHLAAIQGPVQLEASVSGTGAVSAVRVIAGHPLLTPTAVDSLKRWVFPPCDGEGCNVSVKFAFILEAGECTISECPREIQFDWPGTLIVRSKHARAIIN
jgi:hypothetical protein